MKKLYGSIIIFFYFFKFPILIYVAIMHFYLEVHTPLIMRVLAAISLVLVFKDIFDFARKRK